MPEPYIQIEEDVTLLQIEAEQELILLVDDAAGAPGATGPAGEGALTQLEAGSTIHGGRAVMAIDGLIYHPDVENVDHASQVIGVATQSGSIGTMIGVRTSGLLIDGTWVSNRVIFCGPDGVLTQTPGTTGWLLAVARAVDTGTLQVAVQLPFLR